MEEKPGFLSAYFSRCTKTDEVQVAMDMVKIRDM
jgi:hypothetical protein